MNSVELGDLTTGKKFFLLKIEADFRHFVFSHAEGAVKNVLRMLRVWKKMFYACWACGKNNFACSAMVEPAQKYNFRKVQKMYAFIVCAKKFFCMLSIPPQKILLRQHALESISFLNF
jgi:hypothetical protein